MQETKMIDHYPHSLATLVYRRQQKTETKASLQTMEEKLRNKEEDLKIMRKINLQLK
jgi:hypothetical protein